MASPPEKIWHQALANLRTWKRGDERAPHKPLLTLMLIARAAAGEDRHVRFTEIESKLSHLLQEFGPVRKAYHPEFPFWHLQSDGFWTVEHANAIPLKKGGKSPARRTLESADAVGAVPKELWEAIEADGKLRRRLTDQLLENFWPESLHPAIRQAIGLPDDRETTSRVARDPRFREEVLRAYERRCAICGYDGRLSNIPLGLDAAHIRWRAYDGPDKVENGLALCAYHHVAFDSGALGLSPELKVLVSCDVNGMRGVEDLLYRHIGQRMFAPQNAYPAPSHNYLDWHRKEVFRTPERQGHYSVIQAPKLLAADSKGGYSEADSGAQE